MIIRPMTKNDAQQVSLIEKSIFSIPWSKESFEDACTKDTNIYLVCEINGNIAGYCGMWTVFGEGNITNMAVDENCRQQGVAYAMMQSMEELARQKDVDAFFLEVRESNLAAQKLYEKMGYINIGKRKRFYERPVEDAIIMSKMEGLV